MGTNSHDDELPGTLASRFQMLRCLGRGATATVYLVVDALRDGERLALKILRHPEHLTQLRREFEVLSELSHPNLARLYDVDLAGPTPYATFEFIDGPTLGTWACDHPPERVLAVVAGALRALALLHDRGWVHGDLKAANMLVSTREGLATAKIVDLGLAGRGGGSARGTAGYAAPELLEGAGATARSDIYALAAVTLEALSGQRAFGDDAHEAVDRQIRGAVQLTARDLPGVPPPVVRLLHRCLAVDMDRRPPHALALLEQLEEAARPWDLAPSAEELGTLPRARLVGREREMQALHSAWKRVVDGHGPVAMAIVGDRGLGKSHLLAELRHAALNQGHSCVAASSLRALLSQLTLRLADQTDRLRGHARLLRTLVPNLAWGSKVPPHSATPLGTQLRAALFALTTMSAAEAPTLVLLDDIHACDPTERGAIQGLLRSIAQPDSQMARLPLAVVVTSESAFEPAHDAPPQQIQLGPLDEDACAALIHSVLPGVAVADDFVQVLHRTAGGIPWLVEEGLALWIQSGKKLVQDGSQGPGQQVPFSERVISMARQRLAGLDPDTRGALTYLALAARLSRRTLRHLQPSLDPQTLQGLVERRVLCEVPTHTAAAAAPQPSPETQLPLATGQASAANLPAVALAGDHLRQALCAELDPPRHRHLHNQIATAILAADGPPAQQAYHLEQAGDRERARDAYLRACQTGRDTDGSWALRAAELGGPRWSGWAEATRRAARGLSECGELPRALAQLEALAVAELAEPPDRVVAANWALALGQPTRALQLLPAAVAQQGKTGDEHGTACAQPDDNTSDDARIVCARALLVLGQHEQTLQLCGSVALSAEVTHLVGLVHYAQSELEDAAKCLRRAEKLFDEQDDLEGQLKTANNLAMVHQARGELEPACRWYRTALTRADDAGDFLRAIHCRINLGSVEQVTGRLGQALKTYRNAVTDAERLGADQLGSQARLNLATLLLELGDYDQAEAQLTQVTRPAGPMGVLLPLHRAELAMARQDYDQAQRQLEAAHTALATDPHVAIQVQCQLVQARLSLARGVSSEAERLATDAATAATEANLDRLSDEARLLAASARRRLPHCSLEQIRTTLDTVIRRLEHRAEHGRIWRAYHELAEVEALLELPLEASFHLGKAAQVVDALLDQLPGPQRDSLLGRPDFRQTYAATRVLSRAATSPSATSAHAGPMSSPLSGDTLLRLNQDLGRVRDPRALVVLILDQAIELTGAQRGLAILLEGDELRIAAARNVDQETLERGADQFSKRVAQQVIGHGRALVTYDAQQDERFARFESVHELRLRSVVCVPLKIWGSVAGVIYLDNRFSSEGFSQQHVDLLESFGVQAGLALDAARALEDKDCQLAELSNAHARIEALSRELEQTVTRQSRELVEAEKTLKEQRRELARAEKYAPVVGQSAAIQRVLELIDKTAHAEIPVYIYGETGTGKELIAQTIHDVSPRTRRRMVSINCGGLSTHLLASELFGHVKGAFTGADRDHRGLVAEADQGTLFLDEIGEMPPEMQVKLLRVLQSGEYRAVGGSHALHADVRVISASNIDLEQAGRAGHFRDDLRFRLNVLRIDLPPLRARREDIPQLTRHFVGDTPIHRSAMAALLAHDWPGNIRQLKNELIRATALCDEEIRIEHLSPDLRGATQSATSASESNDPAARGNLAHRMAACERQFLLEALQDARGNVSGAAGSLGLSRAGIYYKLKRHGLDPDNLRKR